MKQRYKGRDYNLHNVTHVKIGSVTVPVMYRGTDNVIGPWRYPNLPHGASWAMGHVSIGNVNVPLARFPVKGSVLIRDQRSR